MSGTQTVGSLLRMQKGKARGTLPPAESSDSMVPSWGVLIEGVALSRGSVIKAFQVVLSRSSW